MDHSKNHQDDHKDIVILHQFPPGSEGPSMSPFPVKLETYLRMAKIPYKNSYGGPLSSKGKMPWISYNGVAVADSQFCIDFLKEKLGPNVDMMKHLSAGDKALAHAFRFMVEDSLYWVNVTWRYQIADNIALFLSEGISIDIAETFKAFALEQVKQQGTGRHTKEEVLAIGKSHLRALSTFLDRKKFLMGDQPCEVDCAVFGQLTMVKTHNQNNPLDKFLEEELKNLDDYYHRMKKTFWPDWNLCLRSKV